MKDSHVTALRQAGLRATRQRLAVLEALSGRSDAVTAQDLHREMSASALKPGLATIYRTLAALSAVGEVDTFVRDGEQSFRLCGGHHHHHLVCEDCGVVLEVRSREVEDWVTRVSRRKGFRVSGHTADIYGSCKACVAAST